MARPAAADRSLIALFAALLVAAPTTASAQDGAPPSREAKFSKGKHPRLAPAGPFWPEKALRAGVGGEAAIDCLVEPDGRLSHCRIVTESPATFFFGEAALAMAQKGWMTAGPTPVDATTPADGVWRFRVVYPARTLQDIR